MVVFMVSGLWHGANWKFAIWGMLHGAFFLGTRWLSRVSWSLPPSRWAQYAWTGLKIRDHVSPRGFCLDFLLEPTP